MKRHVFALVFVAVWMAVAPDAAAQAISAKPAPGLHISARIGLSYYGGDLDAANSENDWSRQAFGAELAWHLSPRWAILAAYQQGEYPRIQDPLRLRTAIAMIRFVPVTGRLSPFVQAGINRTYGGVEVAGGPSAGIGINLAITNKLYLFQEANVNFVSPDGAIDNQAGGSNFDLIGFVGGGLRIANLGVRYAKPVRIEKVHIPRTLTTDDAATFRAEVNDDASMPVLFAWTFSDGPRLIGNPISFRFTRPGEHTIQVTAENASGSDVKEYRVFVEQGDIPFVAPEENTPGQIELSTAETPAPRPERTTPRRPVDQLDLAEAKAEASLAISQAELAVAQAELALAQAKEAITLARNATRSIENVTGTPIAQGPSRPAPATVEPAPEPGVETSSAPAPVPSPVSTPE
ncbi:MAG: PKD domain-containing protein, partial [Bacteroidota bacterium]